MIGDIDWAHPLNRQHPMVVGAEAILRGSPNHRGKRWYDITCHGNHGTLVNMHPASDWVPGPVPGTVALDLDGVNDHVDIPSALGITGYPFSFGCWVRADGTTGPYVFLSLTYSADTAVYWAIDIRGGKFSLVARNTSWSNAASTTSVVAGQWYRVDAVFHSATDKRLYVDGVHEATHTKSVAWSGSVDQFFVGRLRATDLANMFDGAVADVTVYNRAISADEHKWLYDNPGLEPMLNKIEPTRKAAPVTGGGGSGFNPAWAMNSTVVAGVNCA